MTRKSDKDSAALKYFSKKIKLRRIELDITQDEMAEKLNITRSSYASYEGGRANPSIHIIGELANILQIRISTLFLKIHKNN